MSIYVSQTVCCLCASSQFKLHIDVKPWLTFLPTCLGGGGPFRISLLVLVFRSCLIFPSAGRAAGMMHLCRTTMRLAIAEVPSTESDPGLWQEISLVVNSSSWNLNVETELRRFHNQFKLSCRSALLNGSLQCFTAHLFLQPLRITLKKNRQS